MLSRVADSLYWMSRYLERADFTARLLDVNFNLMLDESAHNSAIRARRVLRVLGDRDNLDWDDDPYKLTQHLSLDFECKSSIVWCITAARENARQVREQISSEQWERLNILYHEVSQAELTDLHLTPPTEFLQTVMEGVQLFQGASETTMLHGEGWQFIRTGRFLERAFGVSTLLDVYTAEFWDHAALNPKGHEYLEWIGLLRSCTAFEAYCKVYTADITPERILEFLLLHKEFPHTVRFCIESVRDALESIQQHRGGRRSLPIDRVSGRLSAMLSYAELNEVLAAGVNAFLREILRLCAEIQQLIYKLFIDYSMESALAG
jgi:uncharacterized alpha-E superfamily protein